MENTTPEVFKSVISELAKPQAKPDPVRDAISKAEHAQDSVLRAMKRLNKAQKSVYEAMANHE